MAQQKKSKKVLVLKVKVVIQKGSASGVILVFLDEENNAFFRYISGIATTLDHENINLKKPYRKLAGLISDHTKKNRLHPEYNEKINAELTKFLDYSSITELVEKIKRNDFALVEGHFKKAIESILLIDKVKIIVESERIARGDFEELRAGEDINRMVVAQKNDRIKKYIGSDGDLIRKVLQEDEPDNVVIRLRYQDAMERSGIGLIIYNLFTRQFYRVLFASSRQLELAKIDTAQRLFDFYIDLTDAQAKAEMDRSMAQKIENEIKKLSTTDIQNAVVSEDINKLQHLFSQPIAVFIDQELKVQLHAEKMNSLMLDVLLEVKEEKAQDVVEETAPKEKGSELKTVDIELSLSPTKGRRLSRLQAGDKIKVLITGSDHASKKIREAYELNNENNKVLPLEVALYSVRREPDGGYKILVKITDKLYGECIEDEDVCVRVAAPKNTGNAKKKKKKKGLGVGAMVGIGIVLLGIVIAVLVAIFH